MKTHALLLSALAGFVLTAQAQTNPTYVDNKTLHEIVSKVSADNIEKDIQTLVNFGTRHTLSETESDTRGIGAARRWIKQEFERISAKCGNGLVMELLNNYKIFH